MVRWARVRGSVAGIEVADVSLDQATEAIVSGAWRGEAVHLCNSYTMSLCYRNLPYRETIRQGVALADGLPVAYWARGHHLRPRSRPRGPALMPSVLGACGPELSHFFYGGSEETLALLLGQVREAYPEASIAGAVSPPFRSLSEDEWNADLKAIGESGADVVWVGLGTPKQDTTAAAAAEVVGNATFVCVGAAFDFLAGTKREAPTLFTTLGMEWLFRLLDEPRRLWRRYLVDTPYFVARASFEAVARRARAARHTAPTMV